MTNPSRRALKIWGFHELRHLAVNMTHWIAKRFGRHIGFVYVGGYPKSGTTWISQLFGHALDLPYADGYFLPLSFETIVHHHWNYHPAFDHSIYVVRDGRDVMVSLYMNLMKNHISRRELHAPISSLNPVHFLVNNVGYRASREKALSRLFGNSFDPWDVERNLPRFIEVELQTPFISAVKQPWPQYVRSWLEQKQRTVVVKYEEMLADGLATLTRAMCEYTGQDNLDEEDLAYTLERYSFQRQTGRAPGDENRHSFARKGVSGDWKNYFTREARQIFDHYAGQVLVDLGYESDRAWTSISD